MTPWGTLQVGAHLLVLFRQAPTDLLFRLHESSTHAQRDCYSNGEHSHGVPLRMGSNSHGGERKGQLGPSVTVPMSGLPPEGYPGGSRRVCCGVHTLRDPPGYPSGGSPLIGTVTLGPN